MTHLRINLKTISVNLGPVFHIVMFAFRSITHISFTQLRLRPQL